MRSCRCRLRLVATEATFSVASGQTVDVGVGLRALVDGLPVRGFEPTVRIDLSGDRALLCDAWWRRRQVDDGWEYRLAFRNLDYEDVAALEPMVSAAL